MFLKLVGVSVFVSNWPFKVSMIGIGLFILTCWLELVLVGLVDGSCFVKS